MSFMPREVKIGESALLVLMLTVICAPSILRAGSIFDDDYIPPKREAPKADAQPAPTPEPTPRPAPIPPDVAKPDVPPSPTPTVVTARPSIPTKTEQTQRGKLFNEAFSAQLKDRSAPARKKLSESLIKEAAKNTAVPVDYYVLLAGALKSAEEGGNLRLSFDAIDELSKTYDIDALAAKADAAEKVWSAITPATASVGNVQSAFDLMEELLADDDFATAGKVAGSLQHGISAIRDTELKSAVANRIRDFETARVEREKIRPSLERLKTAPADAAANLAVGSFWCFTRGQWDKGLPYLARGNDAAIKSLATSEILQSGDADAVVKVADGWWDVAAKMTGVARTKTQIHAAGLYRGVIANIPGLRRLAIEKRIAETLPIESPRRIDLIELVDTAIDRVNGTWRLEDGVLSSGATRFALIQFRYAPPEEYDFRISFTIERAGDGVFQIASAANKQFAWCAGGEGDAFSGFDQIRGVGYNQGNPTTKRSKQWFASGQHYTSVVKVRKDYVEAIVNNQMISRWKTDYSDMNLYGEYKLQYGNCLGLGTNHNVVHFDLIEVIEVTGRGKVIK